MSQSDVENLGSRSLLAVFWGTGGAAARLILQFGAQVVLARILGPEQYGIFAIGAIVISFSNFFSDIGLAFGLIQKKTVSSHDIRFVFTWQVILGTFVTIGVFLAGNTIASFFGDSRATGVVQALAAVCLLNALAAPSLNLLKRKLDFKSIQIAQISSFILGYVVVGIPLAILGSQVWALVMAWLVQALFVFVLTYLFTRHAVQPLIFHDGARALSSYGGTVLVTNIINWVIGNIDRVIVGRVFASREIGLYATTYNMLQTPTSSLLGIVQPVFFAVSSRIAEDRLTIAESYRALVAAVFTYLLPAFVAVAVVSETFVLALYGPKWHEAAPLFAPLALAMPLFMVWGFTTPMLWTGGHASKEFKTQLPIAFVWGVGTWMAAQHSLIAVAWAVLGLYFLRCLVIVWTASYHLNLPLEKLWNAMRGGLVCSAIVGGLVKACDVAFAQYAPVLRLAVDAFAGLASLLLVLRLVPSLISIELGVLNNKIVAKLPRPLANRLVFLCRRVANENC